jgi:pyrrolidone-carboxylate peptidase
MLDKYRPVCYLGLGEGQPGRIAWEMVARNQQHGTDESVRHRDPGPISPNGPDALHSTWCVPSAPPIHLLPPGINFTASTDAGQFLCNRILWQALDMPPKGPATPPKAAFLHLPPQGEDSDQIYLEKFASFVLALITIPSLR